MTTDILTADLDWAGRDVYVVGSGPNVKGHYGKIPRYEDAKTIVINKAVGVSPRSSYWLCIASNLIAERYFHEYMFESMERGILIPILAPGPLLDAYPEAPYTFTESHPLSLGDFAILPGTLRRGAGTVGCALQLAHQKQAKRCILVGVDMHGRGYFDGTENAAKQSIHPDGTWTQLPMLQRMVDWCKGNGMGVVTMTETKLDVEMI